jgi:hypothetical protein
MPINQNLSLIPRRGLSAQNITLTLLGELTQADLARLPLKPKTSPPTLQKARAIHHKQAQLIAQGFSLAEIAAQVGSTESRLSLLKSDPTFAQLIAFYANQQDIINYEAHARVQETLVDVLELSTNEIQERLSDETVRKKIPIRELRQLAEFAGDRSIAPPKATQQGSISPPQKITLNFGFETKLKPEPQIIDMDTND